MDNTAKKGNTVKVHYCGKLINGEIFDESRKRNEPLVFTLGTGQVIPGFENNVEGMSIGEKKEFIIPSKDAYGDRTEDLIISIPKKNLPDELDYKVGAHMRLQLAPQIEAEVVIVEVKDNEIVFDANHKLAGKDLIFEVELLEIENK